MCDTDDKWQPSNQVSTQQTQLLREAHQVSEEGHSFLEWKGSQLEQYAAKGGHTHWKKPKSNGCTQAEERVNREEEPFFLWLGVARDDIRVYLDTSVPCEVW